MNRVSFRFVHMVYVVSLLLLNTGAAFGCAPRIVPIPHAEMRMTDDGHGFLLGTHRLNAHGRSHLSEIMWSSNMKWWIEEVTHGKLTQLVRLPLDGAFAVQLPAGSYRVIDIIFDSSRGKWHTVIPMTFEIRPWECTSLGISELQLQVGFLDGWITREQFNQQELASDSPAPIVEGQPCPTSMTSFGSSKKHSIQLYEKRLERF